MAEKYGSKLIVLEYHPTSDELGNKTTDSHIEYYNIRGFPTIFFNGTKDVVGGGTTLVTKYEEIIKEFLKKSSGIQITMDGKMDSNKIKVSAKISTDKNTTLAGLTFRWILFEKKVQGKKGPYYHVVRDINDLYANMKPGSSKTLTVEFIAPPNSKGGNTGVALLIQDDGSKEIYHASSMILP